MVSPGCQRPRRRYRQVKCGHDVEVSAQSDRNARERSTENGMAQELDPKAAGARRLDGKVCIVTGAGQGIGRATARRLAQEGGRVVVADRVDESASRTLAELREHGAEAMKAIVDLGTLAGAHDLMRETLAAYGRIDVLVNNVGGTIWIKPYHRYSETEVKLELERSL